MGLENKKAGSLNFATDPSLRQLIIEGQKWLKYLISKWGYILIFAFLGGAFGLGYSYFKKPIYIANTTFVLEDEKGNNGLSSLAGLASIAGVDLSAGGGGIFQGDNIFELYKSRTMIQKTLLTDVKYGEKKMLLVDRFIEFNNLRNKWLNSPELKDISFNPIQKFTRIQDSVLGIIVQEINQRSLKVAKPDKKLSIIDVEVRSEDEFFSKTFNAELVRNVNSFYIDTKTRKSLDNISILQRKTDSVKSVMNSAINSSVIVADATPNLNPTRQIQRTAPVQRLQFSAETNRAILGELVKNLEMAKITLTKETPLIQIVDQPIYPLKKESIGLLKAFLIGAFLSSSVFIIFLIIKLMLKNLIDVELDSSSNSTSDTNI